MSPLRHRSTGRSLRALIALAAVWAGLGALWWGLSAHPVLVGLLFAATLPALWDFVTARPAGLDLTDTALTWHSGRGTGTCDLAALDHVRFDTRLDLSVRVTLVLIPGRRIRLPHDALPPHEALEQALRARGVKTERHHFALFN